MENNKKNDNEIAIIGFILSFFIPIVGLILSIIGLKKSKETNSGKGLAVSGIVISIILIIIPIFVFLAIIMLIFSFNNKITIKTKENIYCNQAYNCIINEDGKYNCKYKDTGIEKDIICKENKNSLDDDINEYNYPYYYN